MAVSSDYLNALANHGAGLIKYIGLVDETGTELSGGDYARKAVTWTTSPTGGTAGLVRPSADLLFNVPAGTVGGWRGYSALTSGTNYGGEDFAAADQETYANPGEFKLLATETALRHEVKV